MDIREQLKGPGQLAERESRYPVTKFKGTLADFVPTDEKGTDGGTYTAVKHQVTNLEVIEADAPYTFPTYEFSISYNENVKSKWDRWVKSALAALGLDLTCFYYVLFNDYLKGKTMVIGLVARPGNVKNRETGAWETGQVSAWEIISIEGNQPVAQAETPEQIVARVITESSSAIEFKQKIAGYPSVTNNAEIFNAILTGNYDKNFA